MLKELHIILILFLGFKYVLDMRSVRQMILTPFEHRTFLQNCTIFICDFVVCKKTPGGILKNELK